MIRFTLDLLLRTSSSLIAISRADPDPCAAIEFLRSTKVDLMVLDMILEEDRDGLDTYKKILEIRPGQRCIIASGFSENDRVKETQALGAGAFVLKPYTLETLGRAARDELDKPAHRPPQLL